MQKELRILLAASAFSMFAAGLFGPIYAVFVENIGGDLLTAGGAYSVFAISAGVLIFFISRWEDKVKHQEKLVVLGYAIASCGFLGYLFVSKPWHLIIVQVIFGVGEAIGTPAYDGLYSSHLDHGKFISQWGLWDSMAWIVTGIAAAVGGFFASVYGFRSLFMVMFVLSLLGLVSSALLLMRSKKQSRKRKR
ncbi:MFS transporter [Candidatus Woesearchaeota archaeon]|nr:MFS transporter [Candidatus Woesearchaeota archaeon]